MGILDDVISGIDGKEEPAEKPAAAPREEERKPEVNKRIHEFSDAFEKQYGKKT